MVARVAFVIGSRKSPPRKTSETSLYFQTLKVTGGGGKNHLNICCRLWSQPRPPFVSLEVPAGYKLVRCQEFNHMFVFRRTKNEKRRRILQTFCQRSDFIASSCWGNESRWIDWKVHSLIRTSLILRDNFLLFVSMTSLLVWIFFFFEPALRAPSFEFWLSLENVSFGRVLPNTSSNGRRLTFMYTHAFASRTKMAIKNFFRSSYEDDAKRFLIRNDFLVV